MGANCCVATRHKTLPRRTGSQFSAHRNVRYSPSWSLQWDNRTHAEDIAGNRTLLLNCNSRNEVSEIKSSMGSEAEGLSDRGSPMDFPGAFKWHKPLAHGEERECSRSSEDLLAWSNSFPEDTGSVKSATIDIQKQNDISFAMSPSAFRGKITVTATDSLPADPSSSRNARRSPGYQLSTQISDSQTPSCKSPMEKCYAEGSRSLIPACSIEHLPNGSHGGSSDGWSMRMFSELVASSQRERWSFDSEHTASSYCKITRSSSHPLFSPSPVASHACGICSKSLKARSSWSSEKMIFDNELSVVAILVCGHVYHAECLESVTSDIDRYDPLCPVCNDGDKSLLSMSGKGKGLTKARNKIARNAIADIDLDGISVFGKVKNGEAKSPKLGASSSYKSFGRPFLRRHFSIGSRSTRPVSENEQNRRWGGFWGRHRKE